MVKVTDKDYYMDGYLQSNLDFCVQRQSKKWDNLLIIDGDEGAGKTTLSWGVGYYWSHKLGQPFGVDNVFFDADKMMRYAAENEKQVIIWDEAALAGLGSEWQNRIQRKLVKALMVCRKKGHFWIFNIPKFFKLNEYLAVDRAFFLLHVYSPDNLERGYFSCYNKKKKDMIYDMYKNTKKRNYHMNNFQGRFTLQYETLLDREAYERMKDQAINDTFGDPGDGRETLNRNENKAAVRISKMFDRDDLPFTMKEFAEWAKIPYDTIVSWRTQVKEGSDRLKGRVT